jgi:hypothetical protein
MGSSARISSLRMRSSFGSLSYLGDFSHVGGWRFVGCQMALLASSIQQLIY